MLRVLHMMLSLVRMRDMLVAVEKSTGVDMSLAVAECDRMIREAQRNVESHDPARCRRACCAGF